MPNGKLLLVEDEEILRSSLVDYLRSNDYEVKDAVDEETAIECMDSEKFNVVITDLFLVDGSGFGIMKHLEETSPDTKCIVITGHASLDSAIRALRKGAVDYLLKPFEYTELRDSVHDAIAKQSEMTSVKKVDYKAIANKYGITKKELIITKIVISEGLSNEEIAQRLDISKNTVKVHLRNIFKKIGVESKTALTTTLLTGIHK